MMQGRRAAASAATQCWQLLQRAAARADCSAAAAGSNGAQRAASSAAASDAPAAPQDAAPWVARLGSRSVICMEGTDALTFLQGMVTNDVRPLAQPGAGPVYAALVNAKGKLLHDIFIYRCDSAGGPGGGASDDSAAASTSGGGGSQLPGSGSGAVSGAALPRRVLLDIDAAGAVGALSWLTKYKLRRPITLEDASSEYAVWARYRGGSGGGSGQGCGAGGGKGERGWWVDPRLPGGVLGERGVFSGGAPPECAAGGGWRAADEGAHRRLRYAHGVAEGDGEMPTERITPLELNLDVLNGVSYTKGCYIGQERNSYTHYRGVIRRRVMPVELGKPGLQPGAEVVEAGGGAAAGVLLAADGALGLAHLKLAPALAAVAAAEAGGGGGLRLQIKGEGGAAVVPRRPGWWPVEWGHEEGAI